MKITIDGQAIEITAGDKNIVDVADRRKIPIPAPCYRTQQNKGCCHGCIIDIDGEQLYACATVPQDGMNIVIDREDLKAIRKKHLLEYRDNPKSGNPCNCNCDCSDSSNCCE